MDYPFLGFIWLHSTNSSFPSIFNRWYFQSLAAQEKLFVFPVLLFVELKFCTVCNLEQPIRTKHCRTCKKWVGTYDHHCPWVGNWIGEKNRKYFFVYIWVQTLQVVYGLFYSFYILTQINFSLLKAGSYLLILSLLSEIFFTLMLLSLIIFHTYLVINNFTTWESLSWNKISYMRIWPRKYGSPFDRGFKINLKQYFCQKSQNKLTNWRMPKKLPSIEQGERIIKSRRFSQNLEKICIKCQ